jgi:hypothetical protein
MKLAHALYLSFFKHLIAIGTDIYYGHVIDYSQDAATENIEEIVTPVLTQIGLEESRSPYLVR